MTTFREAGRRRHPGPDRRRIEEADVTEGRAVVRELRLVLTATDYESAVHFYRDVLGLREQESYEENGGHVVILDAGRATLEINDPAYAAYIDDVEVGARVPGRIRVAFEVPDTQATTARLVDAGARLIAEPTVTPWETSNSRLAGPGQLLLTIFGPVPPAAEGD
jgi:catechol 2,3-dioxygenase-like lactoylglutathione lyase family enzyme